MKRTHEYISIVYKFNVMYKCTVVCSTLLIYKQIIMSTSRTVFTSVKSFLFDSHTLICSVTACQSLMASMLGAVSCLECFDISGDTLVLVSCKQFLNTF